MEEAPPTDCVKFIPNAVLTGGVAGVFLGSVQSAWESPPVVPKNQLGANINFTMTRILSSTFSLAAVSGAFAVAKCASRHIRNTDDVLNSAVGGCAAGGVMGARVGSPLWAAMGCVGIAAAAVLTDHKFDDMFRSHVVAEEEE